jgi:putative endonuclease
MQVQINIIISLENLFLDEPILINLHREETSEIEVLQRTIHKLNKENKVVGDLKYKVLVPQDNPNMIDKLEKYNVDKLVYYEVFDCIDLAINREKQLKGYSRIKKDSLINKVNPFWKDLYNNGKIEKIDSSLHSE